MTAKQVRSTEEARRDIQRGVDELANVRKAALDPTERDVARDKEFDALSVPKGGGTVRKVAPPARRYWPSANSQRAPSRPQVGRRSPK